MREISLWRYLKHMMLYLALLGKYFHDLRAVRLSFSPCSPTCFPPHHIFHSTQSQLIYGSSGSVLPVVRFCPPTSLEMMAITRSARGQRCLMSGHRLERITWDHLGSPENTWYWLSYWEPQQLNSFITDRLMIAGRGRGPFEAQKTEKKTNGKGNRIKKTWRGVPMAFLLICPISTSRGKWGKT